ncbi:MAG: GrpB family protein [Ignavibacteria bacterium]|nr:GrpB family protein [Ignavibacteria bacterium]
MKVEIVPYNPDWKNKFEDEKKFLSELLREFNPQIEHIGSTAIEGLGAKPVVDIQIGMRKYEDLDSMVDIMIAAGYVYYKKYEVVLPDRRYFVKAANPNNEVLPKILYTYEDNFDRKEHPHLFHIHTVELDSGWWRRHIAFRDYLRNNGAARDEYYKLKVELAEKEWKDKNDYTDAKTEFVKSIEKLAGIYE